MTRFRHHFVCTNCEGHWVAERPDARAADCPYCRTNHSGSHTSGGRFARNDEAQALGAER